ncbi:MAG: DEAD/DEAH box helicase [Promethearchaeota archaeon]
MSVPSRNFFIVLDSNRQSKKKLLYDVNFFYLKKFNEKTFSFSYIRDPFFRGSVLFGLDFKNRMRPLSFEKSGKNNESIPLDPKIFRKFLLSDNNKFIAFSDQTPSEEISPVKDMLKNIQIDKNKIINLTFCKACLENQNQKFTILNKNYQIKTIKQGILCSNCAYEIVIRQARLAGLISEKRVSLKLKNFLTHMILKFKDVKKVLNAFRADFNPAANREITLYDIERSPPISRKYLNQKVEELNIPESLKYILKELNISTLLPIQALSVENGLLSEHINQLIMAPTSGGKTLVGELAGVSKILTNRNAKMLYLVPIVALANLRTEEFKEKYKSLKLNIVKKIGESLFEKRIDFDEQDLTNADIIIATYEAIDFILRSGKKEILDSISTIIIDEIQTLISSERGFLLDGLISRLKFLYKNAQFLYLSATLGEPKLLATKLNSELVMYKNRPVPIERHLLLCLNEAQKQKFIFKLVRAAFSKKSKYGFKGQSIIFTNTRKNCESITKLLQEKGINVASYHSGLSHEERKIIEENFRTQKIVGVVATAALAAGVDLPANQVIFESLAMGINWLTVAEFEQMLGRAGRLKKHEIGYAYLLIESGKVYSPKMKETEEDIAIKLLNGKIKDFELIPDDDKSLTELLAFISMFPESVTREMIYPFYENLINNEYDFEISLKKLNNLKLIRFKEDFTFRITRLGQAVAKSFLTIDQCLEIVTKLQNKVKSPLEIALDLKPIKNVYLAKSVVADLAKNVNMKYYSNNLFSASVLSLMNAEYVKKRKTFSQEFIDFVLKWLSDIFNCNCKDSPYCDCGRLNLERLILNLRIKEKFTIEEICNFFEDKYKIIIFKGDIIDYLENLIYSLESIKNILEGIFNSNYKKDINDIPNLIDQIKY